MTESESKAVKLVLELKDLSENQLIAWKEKVHTERPDLDNLASEIFDVVQNNGKVAK